MMEVYDAEELCFPHLHNTSCIKPRHSGSKVLFPVFFISALTVILNLLVIISISHFRQLHKTTNFLLLSLAISDFLVGFFFLPGEASRQISCWFLGDFMCLLYIYISNMVLSASVGNVVLISVDRYVAICDPLHYQRRITVPRIRVCICLCWMFSAFYSITFVKNVSNLKKTSCYGQCFWFIDFFATILDLTLSFIVPVTVIVVLYTRVFVVAVLQARAIRSHVTVVSLQRSGTARKSELKAARTLGILVLVFLTCFCPYFCTALAGDVSFNTTVTVFCLFCSNSCLNPLIYAMFYSWFRKAVKHIVTLKILQPGSSKAHIL